MDSITQAALGAAVAEAGLGRRLGNKAVLWGIALGTLPDLDVLAHPWLDPVQELSWHRGISHSLLFMALASPAIGWVIARVHGGAVTIRRAAWTTFWILFTHVLIDVFTVYGTQVFEPFSNYRLGFDNLFIIDPLFTLPLLVGVGVALFRRPQDRTRRRANALGIALASLYVLWSFAAKAVATHHLATALRAQGVAATDFMTAPTPFNTVLWRGLASTPEGLWVGYYSLLDAGRPPRFDFIPRQAGLLEGRSESPAVARLRWFSEGFWTAQEVDGALAVSDWRFGEVRPHPAPLGPDNLPQPLFRWRLIERDGKLTIEPLRGALRRSDVLPLLGRRVLGEDIGW